MLSVRDEQRGFSVVAVIDEQRGLSVTQHGSRREFVSYSMCYVFCFS